MRAARFDFEHVFVIFGVATVWAYLQKGFFVSPFYGFPAAEGVPLGPLYLSFLLVFLLVAVLCRKKLAETYKLRAATAIVAMALCLLGVLFSVRIADIVPGSCRYAILIVGLLLQAGGFVYVFFGWMYRLLRFSFEWKLSTTVAILLSSLLVSRVATAPFVVSDGAVWLESNLCLGASAVFLLLCWSRSDGETSKETPIRSSSTALRCLPVLIAYVLLEVMGRVVQTLSEKDALHWALYASPPREIVVVAILTIGLLMILLRIDELAGLDRRSLFLLVIGTAIGLALGELFGFFQGASISQVTLDFIETVRALLRALVFVALVLLVYESSLSPVLVFGVFLVLPVVASRLVSVLLPVLLGEVQILPDVMQLMSAGAVAVGFLATLVVLCATMMKSNAGLMLFESRPSPSDAGWESLLAESTSKTYSLTDRETDIFEYLVRGYSAKRIGEKLHISPYTVQNHTKCIYRKMDIHSKGALMDYAEKWRA